MIYLFFFACNGNDDPRKSSREVIKKLINFDLQLTMREEKNMERNDPKKKEEIYLTNNHHVLDYLNTLNKLTT